MSNIWRPPDDPAVDAEAPFRVDKLRRTAYALTHVVAQFRVETSPRYIADVTGPAGVPDGNPERWCNVFVRDVLAAMGVSIPRVRANDQVTYFSLADGWSESTPKAGAELGARLGWPVVVGWRNPEKGRSGHVALVVPGPNQSVVYVAQAGVVRSSCLPLTVGFGARAVRFFVHE